MKNDIYNKDIVLPTTLSEMENYICSSCRNGIKNIETTNRLFYGRYKSLANYVENLDQHLGSVSGCRYELTKYRIKFMGNLKEIKNLIDQGKTINDIKEYYLGRR